VEEVHEFCASFVRAISTSKLYPPGHEAIAGLLDGVFGRLTAFLEAHHELELEIKKDAFLYGGEIVQKEENPPRSLPYFFYKDGMQKLIFLKGLPREEFADFLDLVRTVSLLPLDESDIVDALWEKDYEHIRYISPDEFIEAKIDGGQDLPREFEIDREKMDKGRIDFTPEDAAEIARRSLELARRDTAVPDEDEGLCAPLTEEDARVLEETMTSERRETADRHFPDLMFELLCLEERPEAFGHILSFLENYIPSRIAKAEFIRVMKLLTRLGELLRLLLPVSPSRAAALENFFISIRDHFPPDKIKTVVFEKQTFDAKAFFEYLRFVGFPALPLGADLVEKIGRPGFREEAAGFFEEMAKEDLRRFLREGREDRPFFSTAAIDVCARKPDPAKIPFLVEVLGWKNKDLKLKAIPLLGRFADGRARSALRRLFQDPDEDLRIRALKTVPVEGDRAVLEDLLGLASGKPFRAKSEDEKEAVILALGRSRADEAVTVLRRFLKKRGLFGRSRRSAVRFLAVRALESTATPFAVETLNAARKIRPKLLRLEVEAALRRLSSAETKEITS